MPHFMARAHVTYEALVEVTADTREDAEAKIIRAHWDEAHRLAVVKVDIHQMIATAKWDGESKK